MTDFTDEPYDNPHVPDMETRFDPKLGFVSVEVDSRNPFTPFDQPTPLPIELPPGSVIGFTKRYREDGPAYSFVAIHVARMGWYLTGPNYAGQPLDWDILLDFIGGPDEWAKTGVVATWTPLVTS